MNMFLANVAMLLADKVDGNVAIPGWLDTIIKAVQRVIGPILIVADDAADFGGAVDDGVSQGHILDNTVGIQDAEQAGISAIIVGVVVTLLLIVAFYWLAYAIRTGIIEFNFWND